MSNAFYDALKFVAQIVIPALSALYITIAPIWGLPFEKEIPATLMAVDTFLGALLGLSSNEYWKEGGRK